MAGPVFQLKCKLMLCGSEAFMGPGPYQLLKELESCTTVRTACARMGLSYSKGWKMLRRIERELQSPVLISQQGGAGGGTSQLSPAGLRLLRMYEELSKRAEAAVAEVYQDYLKNEQN